MLAWLVVASGRAPFILLWPCAAWQGWVVNLAMPIPCLLVAATVAAPNPLSFDGRAVGIDPAWPGMADVARHPLLWALVLRAGAHAVAKGSLADALLFDSFAGFALAGMRILDRRKRRQLGEAEWARLAARTSVWPGAALLDGRWRPHAPVIAVSPLPP